MATPVLLLVPGGGGFPAPPPPGPAPTFNAIKVNAGSLATPSVTFGSAPSVGDAIIAITTDGGYGLTPSAGWTLIETLSGCTAFGVNLGVYYHVVQAGDGATFTPSSVTQVGAWGMAAVDITTGNGTEASLVQQIVPVCNNVTPTGVTVSGNGPPNTGVFAVADFNVATSGSFSADPTMTGVTGGSQTIHANIGGGSAQAVVAAETVLTGTDPIAVSATGAATGTNIAQAYGLLVFLNPG